MKNKPTYQDLEKELERLKTTNTLIEKSSITRFLWRNEKDWPVEYVSGSVKETLGYSKDDFCSGEIVYSSIIHPNDLLRVEKEVEDNSKTNLNSFTHEPYRIICKSGKIKWIRDITIIKRNENHEITHFEGIIIDITEQKEAEENLIKSELRWKFALEGNADGLWDWNMLTNEVFFSKQWKTMLGFSEDEISNSLEEWDKRVHPDDKKRVFEDIDKHVSGETEHYKNEHRMLCKDGTYKWILDKGKIIAFNSENKPSRMIGTHSDISYRKKAEQSLKQSEKKFRNIFEHAPVGIVTFDLNGNVLNANNIMLEILESPSIEATMKINVLKNKSLIKAGFSDAFIKCIKTKETIKSENEYITFWNKKTYIRYIFTPIIDNENVVQGVQCIFEDFTDRKENENLLKKSQAKLIESNKTKDKFFSIIAHDLRSPFSSMLGFSEILQSNYEKYSVEKQKKFLSIINEGIKNTSKLLDNLLLWSRSQQGTIIYNPQNLNLYLLSYEVIELLSQSIKNKSIVLSNEMSEDTFIDADEDMLSTILRNLISNAIKFTHKGGEIILKAHIDISNKENRFAEISVIDNGLGVSKKMQSKIFDIGENTSTEGTENEGGTGLGLILCKEFVEKHDGKIWVESETNKGSKFTFTLPLKNNTKKNIALA